VHIIEVSIINILVGSLALRNQSNQSYQTVQSTITSSPPHTQTGNLGRSMENEMRLPIFRGDGSKDMINTILCVKLYGILKMSVMKLLKETSLVLPFKIAH
jgi:hypothetical protein